MGLFGAILLSLVTLLPLVISQTPCSEENRPDDLQACLDAIVSGIQDDNLFWFGNDYNETCPPEEQDSIDCYKDDRVPAGSSLQDILILDPELIDRYVDVVYTSYPGSYSGCDTTVVSDETRVFSLDPSAAVEDTTHPCWDVRTLPQITWDTTGDGENAQYTLIVLDPGYGFLHAAYINVPGNDVTMGDAVTSYFGPGNIPARPNTYVFMVLRQNLQNIVLAEDWTRRIRLPYELQYNLPEFLTAHDMTGPVAFSWLNAAGDIYSAQGAKDGRVADNCGYWVEQALKVDLHERSFIPPDLEVDIFISSDVTAPPVNYSVCCSEYANPATDFTVDAIAANTDLVPCVDVRTGINLDVVFSKRKMFPNPNRDFEGETHTLMIVDPDFPDDTVSTPDQPIIHMMVTGIREGDFSTGLQVLPYVGPLPPDQEPHFYYFLLYYQPEGVTINSTEDYTTNCAPDFCCTDRCLFNITQFVDDYALTLMGASWWSSTNDPWVNYTYIEGGEDPDEFCAGDPDWPDCPANNRRRRLDTVRLY